MIYEDNILQGDLVLNPSIMLLAHGVNVIDTCLHNSPGIPEVRYDNLADGWYTGYQIEVPTQEWLDYTMDTCPETLSSYNTIYYIADNTLYKYNYWDNTTSNVEPVELIKNPNGITNIKISFIDFFIKDALEAQIISLIEQSFTKDSCKKSSEVCCPCKTDVTSDVIEKRDQIQNIIELIDYYVECQDYDSAQELLDQYNDCFEQSEDLCCKRK